MPALTDYVTLGRSGLRVSPLCLGTMTFGTEWEFASDVETSERVIDAYLDAGGNFLDTANIYTKGHSEAVIGDHFAGTNKRDRVVIATKWLGNMFRGDPNGGGAHRKSMMDAVEHSLRRLRTDYIDLYWMHFWDRHTPIEETVRGLDDLVASGKVRYIGFSDTPAWKCAQAQMIAQFRGWSPLIALQIEYSLVERTPESDLIPMAIEMGMGVTPWSPLKGGLLTGKYTHSDQKSEGTREEWVVNRLEQKGVRETIDEVVTIAGEIGRTPAEVALAWCRQRDGVDSTIIGARTLGQLEKNLASMEVVLEDSHVTRLDAASAYDLPFPQSFLSRIAPSIQNGTTVDGVTSEEWPLSPEGDDDRW